MLRKILKLFLLLSWMMLIFSFSMDSGVESTEKSDGVIVWISETLLNKKISKEEKEFLTEKYQFFIRKTAHFTLYFILGFLFLWFKKEFHSFSWKDALIAILFVFLYACSDEIHQLFVTERSGEILDVFLDTLGGVLATLCYSLWRRRYREKTATC